MEQVLYNILGDIKKIDEKIRDLNKKKQNAPSKLLDQRKKLAEVESKSKAKNTEFDVEDKKYKHLKGVITEEKDKLTRAEQKLTMVKNSKEYQAALKEVSQLKKTVTNLDEQLHSRDAEIEKLTLEVSTIKTELETNSKDYESSMVQVKDELNYIERELTDLIESKQRFIKDLPETLRNLYIKLYNNKNGIAVSTMKDSRCTVCNLSLPRQLCNEIMRGDKVHHCPSCQRLIICVNKD
jgi:predicted  nucleic acid-binding Zn-ribbon protein